MRNDNGSEQSTPTRVRERQRASSIRGKVNLAERAKSFEAGFKNKFDEKKFNTFSPESLNRSKSHNNDGGRAGVFAFHKNYPSLSEEQRRSLEGQIQSMSKEERALVEKRLKDQEMLRSPAQIPKRRGISDKMKKMLDDSDHRRTTNSSVRPVRLPMTNFGKGAVGEIDDAPITKHAVKLKNVCAPKLRVDPQTYKPPSNPKTELQRKLLKKVIGKNFVLKNHHSDTEKALVDAMQTIEVQEGDVLAREGESSEDDDNFYVLEKGKVEFLVGHERVKIAKAGEAFGEERLLLRVPNETTVRALEPSTLLKLNQAEYRAIVEKTVRDKLPPTPKPSTPIRRLEETKTGRKPAACQRPPRPPASRSSSPDDTKGRSRSSSSTTKKEKRATPQKKPKSTDEYEIFDPSSLEQHSAEFQRQAEIRRSVKKHANRKDDLEFIKVLGEGQFGEVWLVAATLPDIDPPKQKFAYKIQSKDDDDGMREDAVADIRREIDILEQIHHPFICNLVNTYESETSLDMLLGLIPGGELWDQIHIENVETGEWESGLSEHRARFLTYVLVDTFAFFHSREFLFRDLKPEK